MKLNLQKYQQNFSTSKNTASIIGKKDKNGIIYPETATYALKRRMIVPKWWIASLLLTLGKKHAWYSSFIADHFEKRVYEYFKATAANMFFMIFLWDEIARLMFAAPNNSLGKIKIDLTKFLIGTDKQNESILKKLEENLIKPIKILDVTQVNKTKDFELTKNGYLNIFKKVSLQKDVNGIWLTVHFAQRISNIFGSPDVKSKKHSFKDGFITINPNLFYAMGNRVNLKKALNGLFLEYNKHNEGIDPLHTAFNIEMDKVDSFFSVVPSTAETFYHHGILSFSKIPPSMKISDIKKRQKLGADEDSSPFVFAWGLSSQSKEARNFERMLSKQLNEIRQNASTTQLFHEPPKDELHKIRVSQIKPSEVVIPKPIPTPQVFATSTNPYLANKKEIPVTQEFPLTHEKPVHEEKSIQATLPQEHISKPAFKYVPPQKPNFHTFSERELSIFVTRFYETLNPKQKKMFEHERQSMTREQFRSFMIPILQRTHASLTS